MGLFVEVSGYVTFEMEQIPKEILKNKIEKEFNNTILQDKTMHMQEIRKNYYQPMIDILYFINKHAVIENIDMTIFIESEMSYTVMVEDNILKLKSNNGDISVIEHPQDVQNIYYSCISNKGYSDYCVER